MHGKPIKRKSFYLHHSKFRLYRSGICWSYASPTGGPVLRDETHWRNIAGVIITVRRWRLWIHWRRKMLV